MRGDIKTLRGASARHCARRADGRRQNRRGNSQRIRGKGRAARGSPFTAQSTSPPTQSTPSKRAFAAAASACSPRAAPHRSRRHRHAARNGRRGRRPTHHRGGRRREREQLCELGGRIARRRAHGSLRVTKRSGMVYRPVVSIPMGAEKTNGPESEYETKEARSGLRRSLASCATCRRRVARGSKRVAAAAVAAPSTFLASWRQRCRPSICAGRFGSSALPPRYAPMERARASTLVPSVCSGSRKETAQQGKSLMQQNDELKSARDHQRAMEDAPPPFWAPGGLRFDKETSAALDAAVAATFEAVACRAGYPS